MLKRIIFYILLISILFIPNNKSIFELWAFGKNKLITKTFQWKIKSIEHFDIYYYGNSGKRLVPFVEKYLKTAYRNVAKILPGDIPKRIPFFLYNNHNDFEQTNITLIGEGTGGVTEAYKNRFLVGHLGSQRYLEYVIAHEFTHEMQFEYLFGGFWRSLRIIKFVFYPLWLMEGLAEYTRGDLDSTNREMYLRDAATTNRLLPLNQLHNFNHVLPHQITLAYKESEALIHYIVEEYGADKLSKILSSFRERLESDSVLLDILGLSLSKLDRRFREYMVDKYTVLSKGLSEPSVYGKLLTKKGTYPRFYESAAFSPDGKKIAYISDESGVKSIYIMNLEKQNPEAIVDLAKSITVENIHNDGTAVSFSPDGESIIFAGERKQKDYLYIYNLKSRYLQEISIQTETATSPVFSYDGKKLYFSGISDGFRNIFEYNLETGKSIQLTKGHMDKIDVAASPDNKYLIFSCERRNPSGRTEYDLCQLDLETKDTSFITSYPGDERYPFISSDNGKIYFTSDQDGINDIYALDLNDNIAKRLTKVIGGNFQPKVSSDGKQLMFSSFREGERHIYLMNLADIKSIASYPLGPHEKSPTVEAKQPDDVNDFHEEHARSYKFRASTDLFFPAVFYSSLDGLYLATYWQLSEFLGNHQLQSMLTFASAYEYLDYNVSYGFLKFRPQFYLNFRGQEYFWDIDNTIKKKERAISLITIYPLNRFQRLEFLAGTIDREEEFVDYPQVNWHTRENIAGFAFYHDVVQRTYLETTSGWRMRIAGEFSEEFFGGDYTYQNLLFEIHKFLPLGKEHVLGLRNFTGGSFGHSRGWFRLGGEDRIRGLPKGRSHSGHRVFLNNLEWRFPIVNNINYHLSFMFPDFFFKTFYGALFLDAGFAWDQDIELKNIPIDRWESGYGISFRFHTFVMQSYPVLLNLQIARLMKDPEPVVYFIMGTNF